MGSNHRPAYNGNFFEFIGPIPYFEKILLSPTICLTIAGIFWFICYYVSESFAFYLAFKICLSRFFNLLVKPLISRPNGPLKTSFTASYCNSDGLTLPKSIFY